MSKKSVIMGVTVAEYFGQRTDLDTPIIVPKTEEDVCPFSSGNICKKLKSHNPPVCSVRRSDGTLWIVCSDRLCNTKKRIPLCDHQVSILHKITQNLFSRDVELSDICVKREVRLNVVEGTKYNADYIISLASGRSDYSGPDRMVLEMQGGGETAKINDAEWTTKLRILLLHMLSIFAHGQPPQKQLPLHSAPLQRACRNVRPESAEAGDFFGYHCRTPLVSGRKFLPASA